MSELFADLAMLPSGWARDVRINVDTAGTIDSVTVGADAAGAERLGGIVLPGMPNLHSHAFQRAMAGSAERSGPEDDSFWTWREAMYRFVGAIEPDDLCAIAAQLYIEMLKAGYTAVAEFHYLHNDPAGAPYGDAAEMSRAIADAARRTGIGLTHLPVLYCAGGFGGQALAPRQRRFVLEVDRYLDLVGTLIDDGKDDPQTAVGIAPHSLRAVPPEALQAALAGLDALDDSAPVHIHIAEQTKEVDECIAWSGARPVEWLLANAPVTDRWCLVHATHMTAAETNALARSGAVAGLCPTTEANLGDGIFPLPAFQAAGGSFGIGSDSHISVSPVEELRWLEYGQRLTLRRRNVAARGPDISTGATLYKASLAGGARAAGRPLGAIAIGCRADLVMLDADHPLLAGCNEDQILDAMIFSGNTSAVRDVMIGGQHVVRDGRHADEAAIAATYRAALARLTGAA